MQKTNEIKMFRNNKIRKTMKSGKQKNLPQSYDSDLVDMFLMLF